MLDRPAARRAGLVGLGLAVAVATACRQREHESAAAPVPAHVERLPAPTVALAPVWTHEFAGDPRAVRIDDDGRVFAIVGDDRSGEARLVALHRGEVRWSNTDAFAAGLALEAGEVVAARRNEVVAYEPATGRVQWSAVLPVHVGAHGEEHPHVRAFMRTNDGWLVADASGRTFTITTAACRSGATKACVRATEGQAVASAGERIDDQRDSLRDLLFAGFKAASGDVAMRIDDVTLDHAGPMVVMAFARGIAVFELPLLATQAAGAP